MQAVRRIEEAIFRAHYHVGWVAKLPRNDAGGSAMIAFDDVQRMLGASRAAR